LIILLLLLTPSTVVFAKEKSSIPNVETLELTLRKIEIHDIYAGRLGPFARVVISSEAEGVVEKVNFVEGQSIEKGQILVNIATELLTKQKALAQQNYNLSAKDFDIENILLERNVSTLSKVDSSRTKRDIDKIQLEIAQINLDKSKVKSPLTGVVKAKNVQVGAFVRRGQELLEIMDISRLLVSLEIPERQIQYIQVGQNVNVRIDVFPGVVFSGVVHTRGLEANLQDRNFPIEILLDNPQRELLPGMMARVEMITLAASNEIIVPRSAVLKKGSQQLVYVEKNGMALERLVILGITLRNEVQILSGLQSGDKLIIRGHQFLIHEEKIRAANTAKKGVKQS